MTYTHSENEVTKPCEHCKHFNASKEHGYCNKKEAYTSIARITNDGKTKSDAVIECFEQK